MIRRTLAPFALLALAFGAVGCSNGSGPTEPAFSDLDSSKAAVSSTAPAADPSVTADKRHGADDPAGDDRGGDNGNRGGRRGRGRGADDPAGDDRGGRRNDRQRGAEFEGAVAAVSGGTITLGNGTQVLVNGQTQWAARGDLRTLARVASSVAAGRPTRVEGRGTRQADGSIVAQTIKAEVDD